VDDALEISEQTEIWSGGVYRECHLIAEPKAKRSAGVPVLPARDRLTHRPMAVPWSDFGITLRPGAVLQHCPRSGNPIHKGYGSLAAGLARTWWPSDKAALDIETRLRRLAPLHAPNGQVAKSLRIGSTAAAERELPQLEEPLYFQVFATPVPIDKRSAPTRWIHVTMANTPAPFALMPTDLPPLSDSSAVEILDCLHELIFRFEAHCGAQIHRFYDQHRGVRISPPVAPRPDEAQPFWSAAMGFALVADSLGARHRTLDILEHKAIETADHTHSGTPEKTQGHQTLIAPGQRRA
jgi:hypothetical protein